MIELSEIHLQPDNDSEPTTVTGTSSSFRRVLSTRDFRLLLGGSTTSLLGDQFALIATPWLMLHLTGDPLALGMVLALEGIPRAVFMLVGGAVTDRVAPQRIMLVADVVRGLLVTAMAAVVLTNAVQPWMLYGFAFGFGLVSGFAVPAENSIVPRLLRRDDLEAGNALMMGTAQITAFVGPTLAGATIALAAHALSGIGAAFTIDAVTFAVSATAFSLMRPTPMADDASGHDGLITSIREGVLAIRDDPALRFVFGVLAVVNLLVVGPLMVGIPLVAHQRFAANATAFGVLMGAFAIGNLVGIVVGGAFRPPSATTMRAIVIGNLAGYGLVVASLGAVVHVWLDAGLLAGLGAGNGFLAITFFSWVQARTPERLLGRTISLVTFAGFGLVSASQALAGALARWDLDGLFVVSGCLVVAMTAWAATRPGLRAFTDSLTRPIPIDFDPAKEPER